MAPEQVLPGVWRWADPEGSDRCGTALAAGEEVVLVDPPALPPTARSEIERQGGPIRHVILTGSALARLAAPFRAEGVTTWAPRPSDESAAAGDLIGVDRVFDLDQTLPGGLLICQLPADAAPDGEVALLWPHAGDGLLIAGDVLPVVGQTPVYLESSAPPVAAYQAAVRALLAAEPGMLAPAHQAPPDRSVAFATAYAAHIGNAYHARNAAPVAGPRFLVAKAERALEEALAAPVVLRRPVPAPNGVSPHPPAPSPTTGRGGAMEPSPGPSPRGRGGAVEPSPRPSPRGRGSLPASARLGDAETGAGGEGWLADPFACARCGRRNAPMAPTCGGPPIPRLCPECRAERRQRLPAARLMVCAGGCCTREGARAVLSAARQAVEGEGLAGEVDVVPVSCLGECSLGPFLHVADAQNREPAFAREYREQSGVRARRYAADEGEIVDDESELVLSRFAALVQPGEAAGLVHRLARTIPAGEPKGA